MKKIKLNKGKIALRFCSNAENMRNRPAPASNSSGFKGVSWHAQKDRWRARIKVFYKEIHLGLFKSKEQAALAYNKAAKRHFGNFAHLNTLVSLVVAFFLMPVFANAQLTVPAGGTGKTTFTSGNLIYMGGGTLRMQDTPTTTVSCAGSVSCSTFTVLGPSPYTITGSSVAHDEWTHPGPGQSATTSMLFFNGNFFAPNGTTTNATTTGSLYLTYIANAAGSFLATDPTGKVISTTTAGFESPLTFNSPLSRIGNAVSFLFNTINTWTAQNYFSALFATNATTTNATTTGSQYFTYLSTPAGTVTAVDPNGKLIATTTNQGTVTNIATTFPIQGGPITTTGTISFGGLSTTSPWTGGQLAYVSSNNLLTSVATGTLSATSPLSLDGTTVIVGTSRTVSCPTCSTASFGKTWEIVGGFLAPTTSIPIAVAGNSTSTFNNGIQAGTLVGAPFFNATSTTATSTFAGNAYVKGNLQVDGNFFAPIQLVTSGNATINGALTVTGQTTLATTLSGILKAVSGVVSAMTGTIGQIPYFDGTNTASATSSILINTTSNIIIAGGIATSTSGDTNKGFLARMSAIFATSTPGNNVTVVLTGAADSAPSFSGSTLTLPSNTSYFTAETWGGGGGGGGGSNGGTGGTGGSTTFGDGVGTTIATTTAAGGTGGGSGIVDSGGNGASGGSGGVGSGGDVNMTGNGGASSGTGGTAVFNGASGAGGMAAGGGGGGGRGLLFNAGSPDNGAAFGGGGGGGLANGSSGTSGGGGGGGAGYVNKLITRPSGTYFYNIGARGTAGTIGSGASTAGGTGGSGGIVITIYTY